MTQQTAFVWPKDSLASDDAAIQRCDAFEFSVETIAALQRSYTRRRAGEDQITPA